MRFRGNMFIFPLQGPVDQTETESNELPMNPTNQPLETRLRQSARNQLSRPFLSSRNGNTSSESSTVRLDATQRVDPKLEGRCYKDCDFKYGILGSAKILWSLGCVFSSICLSRLARPLQAWQ